ncbi:MAG: hypothetical protein HY855_09155 [Burkholderiales bacterium]|nr:hypothetical protein [Burkholderiales bacterium]
MANALNCEEAFAGSTAFVILRLLRVPGSLEQAVIRCAVRAAGTGGLHADRSMTAQSPEVTGAVPPGTPQQETDP